MAVAHGAAAASETAAADATVADANAPGPPKTPRCGMSSRCASPPPSGTLQCTRNGSFCNGEIRTSHRVMTEETSQPKSKRGASGGSTCPEREMRAISPTWQARGSKECSMRALKASTSDAPVNWPTVRCGTKAPRAVWSMQCGSTAMQQLCKACHCSRAPSGSSHAVKLF